MTIKAHCMGMEFPKRLSGEQIARCIERSAAKHIAKRNAEEKRDILDCFLEAWAKNIEREIVGEKAKEQASGKTDRSQP